MDEQHHMEMTDYVPEKENVYSFLIVPEAEDTDQPVELDDVRMVVTCHDGRKMMFDAVPGEYPGYYTVTLPAHMNPKTFCIECMHGNHMFRAMEGMFKVIKRPVVRDFKNNVEQNEEHPAPSPFPHEIKEKVDHRKTAEELLNILKSKTPTKTRRSETSSETSKEDLLKMIKKLALDEK